MTSAVARHSGTALHPLHAFFLAGIVPLFIGVLLNDYAYWSSYELQWKNFASWMLIGALMFNGLALLGSILSLARADKRMGTPVVYFLLLLAAFVLGLINSFIHAKDVWASMPTGLILSVITVILACIATWIGLTSWRIGGAR
ncbi:DUF2231 domain-containing protein [Psychrobacter sp. SWN149]|uniref:DUF2231 domain-containing protein n=1 Tax=Psychrobacter sp. SWN149 TaxID=2792057 RepID=UPI0018CF3BD8|nr:DUF2231 domain-containing protein [Psychrobacter sp. SWN149]MBH0007108.1 hypothetical protein [Psychrobacter sp. SWN149]